MGGARLELHLRRDSCRGELAAELVARRPELIGFGVEQAPAPARPDPRCRVRGVTEKDIQRAMREPPQTTRAKLRGDFIRMAKQKRRDYTVDWVHLKLNDQAQRTVLCKDPFRSVDERVDRLIESM